MVDKVRFDEISAKLSLTAVTDDIPESFEGVYCGDFLSRAMSHIEENDLWVTIMNNINVIAVASLTEASAVLLCEDVELMPDALAAAREKEICVLKTPLTAFEVCGIIYRAKNDKN